MVVLYSEPRKYELKNEALYNRFYNENGSQKVVGLKNENLKPSRLNNSKDKADLKIISSSGLTGNIKSKITYLEDAVITISGSNLKAKHVELDGMQNILTATHAIISNGGSMIVTDKAVFDLTNGTYRTYESNSENDKQSKKSFWDYDLREKQDMIAKSIRYTADSVKISADKNTITVMGKAKMSFKSITIDADEISYNKFTKEGVAKNLLLTNSSGMKIKGSKAKFKVDDKAGVEIWQNEKENLVVDL
jgi:lipopolysaccharide assembly outer membrane protein LptD (OstA)